MDSELGFTQEQRWANFFYERLNSDGFVGHTWSALHISLTLFVLICIVLIYNQYLFPMTAVAKYHNLGGLKTTEMYSCTALEARSLELRCW